MFGGLRFGDRPRIFASRSRDLLSMLIKDTDHDTGGLATWVHHCWRFWCCRSCWPLWPAVSTSPHRWPLSLRDWPASNLPGLHDVVLDPELVLYVILPPLLWSAGTESSYVALRKNLRPISLLAVGLPLATTFAVGFVAYKTVPELTVGGGADPRCDRGAARCGVGDRDRQAAGPAAPDDGPARR